MSGVAIKVENLGKKYRIGAHQEHYKTLREALVQGSSRAFKRMFRSRSNQPRNETIWALKDVSFEIKPGEVVGIIGRNGAGKSTLLKILSRITEPTEGSVEIRGRVGSLLEVGTGFHPELTGRENIYMNGSILGMRKAEIDRKFDEIVDFAEIEKFLDTPVKRYSSGMYVRLAFAVAAHLEPEILLVDEVLAVGDAAFQKKCLRKMGDISEEGRTVLFVSHNMTAVSSLCQKSLLIDNGKLAIQDDTEKVISSYLRFSFDSVRNNLSERTDRKGDGRMLFTGIDVFGKGGDIISNIKTGQEVTFMINFRINDMNCTNSSIVVGLFFKGLFGQALFSCLSRVIPKNDLKLIRGSSLACVIKRFPLLPGEYQVDLLCKIQETIADLVQPAGTITVVPGDFFGSGKLPPPQNGEVLIDFDWQVVESKIKS